MDGNHAAQVVSAQVQQILYIACGILTLYRRRAEKRRKVVANLG